jgi:hypothetical protein
MGIKMDETGLYVNDKGLKRRKRRCQIMVISWLIKIIVCRDVQFEEERALNRSRDLPA